jgi:UDP-N-acetylmuramyl tripeptide synthase
MALPEMQHAADAKHCRRCGAPYRYDAIYMGHLGRYHCDRCGASRPEPAVAAHAIALEGIRGAGFTLHTPAGERAIALPLPGLYNVYNALGAAALSLELGASLDDVAAGLQAVSPAFGRAETLRVGGRDLSILLVKNPAGANEVLRTLTLEDGEHDVLAVLNDNVADGRDVSWVWDADFEVLAPRVRRVTCSGTRAAEMALRLKYAGVPTERIAVEPDLVAGLDRALEGDGALYALPTYTAMLALRDVLVARGAARESFA